MVKAFIISAFFIGGLSFTINAQNQRTDSLKQLLKIAKTDSNRVKLLISLAQTYYFSKPDTCLSYSFEALLLARSLHFTSGEIAALNISGEALRFIGNYPRALKMQLEALELNRKIKDPDGEAISLGFIGFCYVEFKEYRQGLQYLLPSLDIFRKSSNQVMETFTLTNIGNAYDLLNMYDSALFFQRLANNTYSGIIHGPLKSLILTRQGNAFVGLGRKDSALVYFKTALRNANSVNDKVNGSNIQSKIAKLYESTGQLDSSLFYARKAFTNSQQSAQTSIILESSNLLVKLFRQANDSDSAFFYQGVAYKMNDRLYGPHKFKELQLLVLEEQEKEQKNIREHEAFRNKTKYTILISALAIFLLLAFILIRNNRHKQKANKVLESTLSNLKATQHQLIQSEKMASLGELTAGIAHEIQNPLNFVNNFSEINKELLSEMKDEIEKGNMNEVKAIADDVIGNQEKINHHGKRADAIVKGMLQHSRSSSGVKEPTDINTLADEYLRLAYHGLRAKDKSFNATMKTAYEEGLGKINVIPQDIGRVILNLITNAFYVVDEKAKKAGIGYEPIVSVITKKENTKVLISVKDNGNGIPQKIVDKVFQPFFTTKPTGKGTGLGLSLSFDIIKAHGGEIIIDTKEDIGTTFTIVLPK